MVRPLCEILVVATGPVVMLAGELARIDGIESACLYGSFTARLVGDAGPAPHDIDVMVVGDPDVDTVYEACTQVEATVHRRVNPRSLTPKEFAVPSGFLDSVRSSAAVSVIGGSAVAPTPLTCVQQAVVLALVEARRLAVVPAHDARAISFLHQAEERLNQLPLLTSVVVRDGCRDNPRCIHVLGSCLRVGDRRQPRTARATCYCRSWRART